jgi:hypothetical protein
VPMARGAPSTAGATVVPQGEPLWNQFRARPQQRVHPLLSVTAASASKIVSFLMIGSPRTAKAQKGGGGLCFGGAKRWVRQIYITGHDVQIQHANFLPHAHRTRVEKVLRLCRRATARELLSLEGRGVPVRG